MEEIEHVRFLIPLLTVLGSGVSAYVGVKIAIVRMQGEIDANTKDILQNAKRIDRLEDHVFIRPDRTP